MTMKIKKPALRHLLTPALLCLLTALAVFMTTYLSMKQDAALERAELAKAYQEQLDTLGQSVGKDETLSYMQSLVDSAFYGQPGEWNASGSMDDVYRAYVKSLNDPYAAYYSPEEYQAQIEDSNGQKAGIGIQVQSLTQDEGLCLSVLLVIPNSPAEKAGLLAGDRIVAVDGVRVADLGYNAAVEAVGGDLGTEVRLSVLREGAERVIPVTRDHYENVSVYGSLCSDGVTGLVKITGFDGATPKQFESAVDTLLGSGAKRLIFDVRENGGGSLSSVLSTLSYLVEKDQVLIRIYDRDGNAETRSSDSDHTVDCPMAVLINGHTASAAELFTSCLRDLKGATLVGTKSYGKGCMQSVYSLPNGGGMKFTNKMYNPPSDVSYHGIGISPDREVSPDPAYADQNPFFLAEEQDLQLQAALLALSGT